MDETLEKTVQEKLKKAEAMAALKQIYQKNRNDKRNKK